MLIEGKCLGQKLRVSVEGDVLVVERLNGFQAGSVFRHELSELKSDADLIIDRMTLLAIGGWFVSLLSGAILLLAALRLGRGNSLKVLCVSATLLLIGAAIVRFAPKRRSYLWSTKAGVQAFGLDETEKNVNQVRGFLVELKRRLPPQR